MVLLLASKGGFAVWNNLGHNVTNRPKNRFQEQLMVDRICLNCRHSNASYNDSCENCGVSLDTPPVIMRQQNSLVMPSRQLPARQLKRLGVSVAVSVAALLAEVAFIYLRRRVDRMQTPSFPFRRRRALPVRLEEQPEKKASKRIVTVYSERVVEERRWGRPVRRIINRLAWQSEELLEP